MLVHELKKIMELDTRISDMHRELADLYAERLAILDVKPAKVAKAKESGRSVEKPNPKSPSKQTTGIWVREQYARLEQAWGCYDISVPAFSAWEKRLRTARQVIDELGAALPELDGALDVVAVPPTKLLAFPVTEDWRLKQEFSDGHDYVNSDIPSPAVKRSWRLLVVYGGECGLKFGLPRNILDQKSYLIGGYDTRALGAAEYAALTLQYQQPIDDGTWTLLMKNYKSDVPAVSATFADGRYRFDIDEAGTGLDIDYFRPAVEVRG